jgi:exodeoxyribonuclease VII small subunit
MNGSEKPPRTPDDATGAPVVSSERFDEILLRLRGVVEKLETGNLVLEDSLKFFEEGIALCRRGASILDAAERKVEVLLSGPAANPRTEPFEASANDAD